MQQGACSARTTRTQYFPAQRAGVGRTVLGDAVDATTSDIDELHRVVQGLEGVMERLSTGPGRRKTKCARLVPHLRSVHLTQLTVATVNPRHASLCIFTLPVSLSCARRAISARLEPCSERLCFAARLWRGTSRTNSRPCNTPRMIRSGLYVSYLQCEDSLWRHTEHSATIKVHERVNPAPMRNSLAQDQSAGPGDLDCVPDVFLRFPAGR